MKIAMLSWESLHSIRVGGIAPHVSELSAALVTLGHEVHVFTRLGPGQPGYDLLDGVHYHRCGFEPSTDFVTGMERMSDSFVWHLAEEETWSGRNYDIVHGHDWLVGHALRRIKDDHAHPVVVTIHSTEYGRCGNELFWHGQSRRIRELEWESTYIANRVICVSESLKKEVAWLYSVPGDKTTAVYNGVDVRPFDAEVDTVAVRKQLKVGLDEPCVLFAGRLAWQKGPDLLVEAIPRVLREHPSAKFVFAGEGLMRSELESRIGEIGSADATRFVGYQSGASLIGLFKTADVVCVPSRNEPFGIVILEAWSATKPVVATRTGGPAEFVTHKETGWTVPMEIEAISDGLDAVLSDEPHGERMGRAGRREAETRFSWNTIARQTESIYESVFATAGAEPDDSSKGHMMAQKSTSKSITGGESHGASSRYTIRKSNGLVVPAHGSDGNALPPSDEDIRRRAHEIYLSRNGTSDDPATDWRQAERELQVERAPALKPSRKRP